MRKYTRSSDRFPWQMWVTLGTIGFSVVGGWFDLKSDFRNFTTQVEGQRALDAKDDAAQNKEISEVKNFALRLEIRVDRLKDDMIRHGVQITPEGGTPAPIPSHTKGGR